MLPLQPFAPKRPLRQRPAAPPLAHIGEVRLLPPTGHTLESAAELPLPNELSPALLRALAFIAREHIESQPESAVVVDSRSTKPNS